MNTAATLRVDDLTHLVLTRLADCVEPASKLYARQIRDRNWAPTLGTESITSSAICLIGQNRAGMETAHAAETCRRMAAEIGAHRVAGPVGLMLWACSALRASRPFALLQRAGHDAASLELAIPALTTMEVAWMVSGLLHADTPAFRAPLDHALRELEGRFVRGTHLFRHASPAASLAHRTRGRVANFADQIYPVQALSFASIVLGRQSARQMADRAAARLVELQGPLGQWWWHYDAVGGHVAERFPVYSVHQHAMAPMALHVVARAGGPMHEAAIERSRTWLFNNELGVNMLDRETGVIWRSIEREEGIAQRALRQAREIAGLRPSDEGAPRLKLNYEIRPYEWGWLLYANALETSKPPEGHIL